MANLYSFGCSYTNYHWPTYSDYIGTSFDKHIKGGESGCGNKYIFKNVCDKLDNIRREDLVIVQWTSLEREDKYFSSINELTDNYNKSKIQKGWSSNGSIFELNGYFDESYIKNYFSYNESFEMLESYCTSIKYSLEKIGCKYFFIFMLNPFETYDDVLLGEPLSIYYNSKLRTSLYKDFFKDYTQAIFFKKFMLNLQFNRKSLFQMQSLIENNQTPNHTYDEFNNVCHLDYHPKSITHLKIALQLIQEQNIRELVKIDIDKLTDISLKIDKMFEKENVKKSYSFLKTDSNHFNKMIHDE